MLNPRKNWLPIGSIVRLEGGERLVMVAGYMAIEGSGGRVWDYIGYLYPEGNQHDEALFFQRELIESVYQLGFADADCLAILERFEASEEEYAKECAEINGTQA